MPQQIAAAVLQIRDEQGEHGHAASFCIVAFKRGPVCLGYQAGSDQTQIRPWDGELGSCFCFSPQQLFSKWGKCKERPVLLGPDPRTHSIVEFGGVPTWNGVWGLTKAAARPSSNTAIVGLCTTLSVRHMGAIGLDTSDQLEEPCMKAGAMPCHQLPQLCCGSKRREALSVQERSTPLTCGKPS